MKLFNILGKIGKNTFNAYDMEEKKEVEISTVLPYETGDVVYFNEEENDYLLTEGLTRILASQIFRELTNNGEKSYAELSEEDKATYDETKKQLDESLENPLCLGVDDTLYFLATREAMREVEAEV